MKELDDLGLAMVYEGLQQQAGFEDGGMARLERLRYGAEAISAFKYQGVLPAYIKQQIGGGLTPHDYTFKRYLEAAQGNRRVAHILWTENQRRLKASTEYEICGFVLDPEGEEVRAFMHYTQQNLAKSRHTLPRWDDWSQVVYESNGGRSDLLPGVDIPKALSSLTTNYEEVKALFLEHKKQILEILETGNLVIISNHCTWLNLPLIAAFLHEILGISLDKINTILGGALTTQHAGFEVANMNRLLKTVPDTPNGRLDDVTPGLQKRIPHEFLKALIKQLRNKGEVFIISPGGTTDRVLKDKIELLEASESTRKLVKKLAKNHHVWPIATHSGALYAGQKIQLGPLRLTESGILPPGGDANPLRVLKNNIEGLNDDRTVGVHTEERYIGNS